MAPLVTMAAIGACISCAAAGTVSALGVAGSRGGWPDVFNSFAPFQIAGAALGGGLAWFGFGPGLLQNILFTLAVTAAATGAARVAPEIAKLRRPGRSNDYDFRVLSANVWRDNPTPEGAVAAILACDADAVILQEADGSLARASSPLKARYPYICGCPHAELRIFSKAPVLAHDCSCKRAVARRGRLLWASAHLPHGEVITLATTHFSQPYGNAQVAEREGLAVELKRLASGHLILAGDFNTTPWSVGMARQDDLLSPLRRRTIGWFSWPARLGGLAWHAPLLPIDHIYTGPGWGVARLRRVRIPGSDHFGTEAALTLAAVRDRVMRLSANAD